MIVTTSSRPGPAQLARARVVADRCRVPCVERRGSLADALGGDGLAYVVGRHRDELRTADEVRTVHEGLLRAKAHAGRAHPLVRAVAPRGASVRRVVDVTLGYAEDALLLAEVLGCEVVGAEVSSVVFSLLEEGLPRLAAGGLAAAAHVEPRWSDGLALLDGLDADAADVVTLSPMFDAPRRAAPGFHLLRSVARLEPLDPSWVERSLRVAPRAVFKLPAGQGAPLELAAKRVERVQGKAVDFLVVTREAP